jgi:HEAT repeat protein
MFVSRFVVSVLVAAIALAAAASGADEALAQDSQHDAAYKRNRERVLAELEAFKPQLTDASAAVREKAVKEICRRHNGRSEAVPVVRPLCGDPDVAVRRAAVETLAEIISRQYALHDDPTLPPAVDGPFWSGQPWQEFVKQEGKPLIAALTERAKDEDAATRKAAAAALYDIDIRSAAAGLRLETGDGAVRKDCPNGKALMDGRCLYNAAGVQVGSFAGGASSWSFSADGRFLVVGTRHVARRRSGDKEPERVYSGTLSLYDAATGKELGVATGRIGPITHVAFSADDKRVMYRADMYRVEQSGK